MIGYTDTHTFDAWANARGFMIKGSSSELLTQALDWLELQQFAGSKTDAAQPNQWPRTGVTIDGVSVPSDTVPQQVIDLQMRVAADIDAGMDPSGQRKAAKASVAVVGAVAVTYEKGSTDSAISVQAQALLTKLRGNGFGFNQFEVRRG